MINLIEDRSLNLIKDDETTGYLYAKAVLYQESPPSRKKIKKEDIVYEDY